MEKLIAYIALTVDDELFAIEDYGVNKDRLDALQDLDADAENPFYSQEKASFYDEIKAYCVQHDFVTGVEQNHDIQYNLFKPKDSLALWMSYLGKDSVFCYHETEGNLDVISLESSTQVTKLYVVPEQVERAIGAEIKVTELLDECEDLISELAQNNLTNNADISQVIHSVPLWDNIASQDNDVFVKYLQSLVIDKQQGRLTKQPIVDLLSSVFSTDFFKKIYSK